MSDVKEPSSPVPASGTLAVCNASQEKLEEKYDLGPAELCPVCQVAVGRHRFLPPTAAVTTPETSPQDLDSIDENEKEG
jgi:hypothetical protein